MTDFTYVFERVERKFLLTPRQYEGLMRVLPEYMQVDQYGESAILIPMPVRQPAQIVMKPEPQDFRFLIQWA